MQKLFYPLVALLPLISSLSAQIIEAPDAPSIPIFPISTFPIADNPLPTDTAPTPDNPSTTDNPVTPSTPAVSYPIGTIMQPVSAGEYCTFLTDTLAPQSEPSLDSLKEKFGITDNSPLACDGSVNKYNFYWDLNRSEEIIATVPSSEVQQLFNTWRDNPYSQELLDYMLDVYYTDPGSMGSKTSLSRQHVCHAPINILQLYPNSTTLAKARNLALVPVGGQYLLYNERGISVSLNPNAPINPRNFISIARYQVPQPDYHRPLLIGPKI